MATPPQFIKGSRGPGAPSDKGKPFPARKGTKGAKRPVSRSAMRGGR